MFCSREGCLSIKRGQDFLESSSQAQSHGQVPREFNPVNIRWVFLGDAPACLPGDAGGQRWIVLGSGCAGHSQAQFMRLPRASTSTSTDKASATTDKAHSMGSTSCEWAMLSRSLHFQHLLK